MVRELAVLNVALVFLTACGGDDDGIECSTFSACGGDPAGEWNFVDACVDETEVSLGIEGCPEATATFGDDYAVSGTLSMNADGTYDVEQNLIGTLVLRVPLTCFAGAPESCDEASELLELECTASGSDCECPDTTEIDSEESGTWEVDGDSLTLIPDGEAGFTGEFCIDGDRLEIRSPPSDLDLMSTLILERS
jgi:hypothetical protein